MDFMYFIIFLLLFSLCPTVQHKYFTDYKFCELPQFFCERNFVIEEKITRAEKLSTLKKIVLYSTCSGLNLLYFFLFLFLFLSHCSLSFLSSISRLSLFISLLFLLLLQLLFSRYDAFDFHKECAKIQWHKLNILLGRLTATQEEYG